MALPDYSDLEAGTPIEWSTAGGGALGLTLTSLANDAGRDGAKSATLIDGTKGMPEFCMVDFESAVTSAATTGKEVEVYFGQSVNATAGTANPGGHGGADAAATNPDEKKHQLSYVGALVLSNALGTGVQKQEPMVYKPVHPYVMPRIVNKSGVALSGTAGNHKLILTPYYRRIKD